MKSGICKSLLIAMFTMVFFMETFAQTKRPADVSTVTPHQTNWDMVGKGIKARENNTRNTSTSSQYTYSSIINGVFHKLHFAEEGGTWTVQHYDENSNKWVYGSILASEPGRGYWKMKDGAGKTWDVTTYDDNTCVIKDASGYSIKYWLD